MADIVINGFPFKISNVILEHLLMLTQYPEEEWSGEPLTLEHHYFQISRIDIKQALEFVSLSIINKIGLIEHHIDNILLTSFIIDYLGFDDTSALSEFAKIHSNRLAPVPLFMYNKDLCIRSLSLINMQQLVNFGYQLEDIIKCVADDTLINIYDLNDEYLKYTPLAIKIYHYDLKLAGIEEDKCQKQVNNITDIDPLLINGNDYLCVIKSEQQICQEKLIFDKDIVLQRLDKFCEGMLNGITWDNIALLGGSLSIIMCTHIDYNNHPAVDIDLFIWGDNAEARQKTINRLLIELRTNLDIVVFQRNMVITIVVRNKTRNIQIIDSGEKSLADVIYNFDFSISKVGYDGRDFFATPIYLFCLRTRYCYCFKDRIPVERIAKDLSRGFSFLIQQNAKIRCHDQDFPAYELKDIDIFSDESVARSENKCLYATNEPINRLLALMKGLFGRNYKLLPALLDLPNNGCWKNSYSDVPKPIYKLNQNNEAEKLSVITTTFNQCRCGFSRNEPRSCPIGVVSPIITYYHKIINQQNNIIKIKLTGIIIDSIFVQSTRHKQYVRL